MKVCAIPCPHQPPTRGDNTGDTATPGANKQLLPSDRLFKRVIYIWWYIYIYIYYIYIYIIIHRQICFVLSELISVARQDRFPKLGSKPGWLKRQSKILPLNHEEASIIEVNLNGYESQLLLFTYIRLTATESSIHMKSLAYTLMATQLLHSLESSTLQG